jgi:hypothetical protein
MPLPADLDGWAPVVPGLEAPAVDGYGVSGGLWEGVGEGGGEILMGDLGGGVGF